MNNIGENIFLTAELFRDAAQVIFGRASQAGIRIETKYKLFVTGFTNEAIAVELYLKALFFIENNKTVGGHFLKALFSKLHVNSQNTITNYYNESIKNNPVTRAVMHDFPEKDFSLLNVLKECNEAFDNFRYEFEAGPNNYSLGDFLSALRKFILELRPHYPKLVSPRRVIVVPPAAFMVLKEDGSMVISLLTEAPNIYFNALSFADAANLLGKRLETAQSSDETKFHLHLVAISNQAFSIELFLKTLLILEGKSILLEGKDQKRTHNLKDLYHWLDQDNKDKILEIYNLLLIKMGTLKRGIANGRTEDDYQLENVLEWGKDAVVAFRYLFEQRMENYALANFLFAIMIRISELKPEFPILLPYGSIIFDPHPGFVK